ncbi:hypothetical protein ABMX85_20765 [Vibrio vulnificus]|uniref:RelA/SpoT domain-containing protein n=1 Tax=Vibrio vulnificus TaxID=672 RepID=UPI0040586CC3
MYFEHKEKFLSDNNISNEALERSKLGWEVIAEIGDEHKNRIQDLTATAELFVRTIQRCNSVHSVRWRIKSPEHLMEKLIRKTDPKSGFYSQKYEDITLENYHEIVTDLVGVRAIHLFKDQFSNIDAFLCDSWEKYEDTTVYTRKGDLDDDYESLEGEKIIKEHEAGYRSIHYVFKTKPMIREVLVEVQVRTIFEEGWSEIDHTVRYPNFSDNELVGYFLKVFNRLAGSADEMGSFVKSLAIELGKTEEEMNSLQHERHQNNNKIEELFNQLETATGRNEERDTTIAELRKEIDKLKEQSKPITLGLGTTDPLKNWSLPSHRKTCSTFSRPTLREDILKRAKTISNTPKKDGEE